ncbi:MAG: B12-binding domain-containing radical SAM protein [Tyzzerella sp.]|nr:B12-binding domain-containing radical SAM protein [Tyzzerella sp.]
MKTILVAINAKYIHSNLAVYSLRTYAKQYREEISIVEYTINQQMNDILMDLYKKKPDILCFSCYIWNLTYVESIIREIRKLMPELPIWVGGPEVSYDSEDVLERLPEVTGVMFGEGEETFLELMQHYHSGGNPLKDIMGVAYRDEDKSIHVNAWRPVIDLSTVPFVYEDMEDFKNKIIYYESSRGCPFSCSYCLSSVDKCLRFRDINLVKKELQFFIDEEVPQVKFVDRTFNCNHKHAMAIWRYLMEHDKGITNFHFEVAADLLNEEELQLIEQMRPGLIQLEIGVQSTNEVTIKEIRRTMKFSEVARIAKRISQMKNVHQHLDLIAGLPYEDLESFKKSFNDVYRLYPEQLQLGFLKVLKGSYMEEQKENYGLVYQSKPPYEVLYTKWLSYEDVLELKKVEEMVEVYYNSGQFAYTLRQLEKEFSSPYQMYCELGTYYEQHTLHMMSHSRVRRYEILLEFIKERHTEQEELYRELLVFDMYLRERVKSRPAFAGDYTVSKEVKREQGKMSHVEMFHYDVAGDCRRKDCLMLFDYENRSIVYL